MTKTNFVILKQCEHCAETFEAQKRTTRCCSRKCSSNNYKLRKRQQLKNTMEGETVQKIRPKVKALDLAMIKHKEYLTVSETATLFGFSTKTIYRMIESNDLNATNLAERLTRIRRKDIEKMFEPIKQESPKELTTEICYTTNEIIEKYKVSQHTVYSFGKKYKIQRLKQNGITYYSKAEIDNLFIL